MKISWSSCGVLKPFPSLQGTLLLTLHLLANLPQRPRSTVPRSRRIRGLDAFAQSPGRTFLANHDIENKHHHLTKTIDVLCRYLVTELITKLYQIQSLRLFDSDLQPDRLSYCSLAHLKQQMKHQGTCAVAMAMAGTSMLIHFWSTSSFSSWPQAAWNSSAVEKENSTHNVESRIKGKTCKSIKGELGWSSPLNIIMFEYVYDTNHLFSVVSGYFNCILKNSQKLIQSRLMVLINCKQNNWTSWFAGTNQLWGPQRNKVEIDWKHIVLRWLFGGSIFLTPVAHRWCVSFIFRVPSLFSGTAPSPCSN